MSEIKSVEEAKNIINSAGGYGASRRLEALRFVSTWNLAIWAATQEIEDFSCDDDHCCSGYCRNKLAGNVMKLQSEATVKP